MRDCSNLVHKNSSFIKTTSSLLPLYSKTYVEPQHYIPKNYFGIYCTPIEEDDFIYHKNWVEHIGLVLAEEYRIKDWANLNMGGITIPLQEWQTLDIFTVEAIVLTANKLFTEQEKKAKEAKEDLENKIKSSTPYRSSFSNIPKPTFIQK